MLSPPRSPAMDSRLNQGGQAPMDGMVLCCTSISPEKRADLASMAAQMGAKHKLDLTSDVTHLIVGDTDTPKYKFVAKERPDVKCLLPAWVEALRELWMADVEPDMQALETRYMLPTLHNLRICLTGFEDMDYRKKLEDDVTNNGGEYRGNLTKDVTHLIAKEPSGAKYKYAIDWKIKIVGVEWLEQSLERGLILDEQLYNLSLPPAERGRNAWIRRTVSTSSLGKRSFDEDAPLGGPRKLRRVASARLNSQNVGLWTDIVKSEVKSEEQEHNQWSEQLGPQKPVLQDGSSMTMKSVATLTESSDSNTVSPATTADPAALSLAASYTGSLQKSGVFAGKRICLHGFNEKKTAILHNHLLSHGAEILPDYASFTSAATLPSENEFLLVPHDTSTDSIPILPIHQHHPVLVTELWVERNLHRKQYIRPKANITNVPFRRFPIPGFERLVVCSTKFEGIDLLHMSKAVKLMGATYEEEFSPQASVLVCNKVVPGHEKLCLAQLWKVPTVTVDWLWDCIGSGDMKDFRPYHAQIYTARPEPHPDTIPGQTAEQTNNKDNHGTNANSVEDTDQIAIVLKHGANAVALTHLKPAGKRMTRHDGPRAHNYPTATKPQEQGPLPTADISSPLPQPTTTTTTCLPLQDISPNSSPPKPPSSPSKPASTTIDPPCKPPSQDPGLSSVISSLLAHHQNARLAKPAENPQPQPPPTRLRRKRQLLGRAPSNTSNISRASSVDTVNTDGVGTPVELTLTRSASTHSNHTIPTVNARALASRQSTTVMTIDGDSKGDVFDPLATYEEDEPTDSTTVDQLQMTQLGYEDPDALAWREQVERKLGGVTKREGEQGGRRVQEVGRVKDLTGGAVGRRTRLGVRGKGGR